MIGKSNDGFSFPLLSRVSVSVCKRKPDKKKKEIKKSFDYLTKWVMKRLAFANFFYLIKNFVVITQGVLELLILRISILAEQSPHIICFLNFKDAILTAQRS